MTFITSTFASGDQHDVQYNKDGYLHGDNSLEWNDETNTLSVLGDLRFPFLRIHLVITVVSGILSSLVIHSEGFGYKNGTYNVTVPGGQNGSVYIHILENKLNNVYIFNSGSGYTDGDIVFYPEIEKFGTITANKFTNGTITIDSGIISGVSSINVQDKITTQILKIKDVDIVNNSITNVDSVIATTLTTTNLNIGNISINDTNGLTGLTNITASGSATVNKLNINNFTISDEGDISGVNNLSATGNITVSGAITSGTVAIDNNSITGVVDMNISGTLYANAININTNTASINSFGDFTTNGSVTVNGLLSAATITDGIVSINNGIISGASGLTVSGSITLSGTDASISIGTVAITNNSITGLASADFSGDVDINGTLTTNTITSPNGTALNINSPASVDNVIINQVKFQDGTIDLISLNVSSGGVTFTSLSSQKIHSPDANITIEAPNGVVKINDITFDTHGNISSVNDLSTTGTITASQFIAGNVVIANNNISGVSDLITTTLTTSGTLSMTGDDPKIESTNKITISSGLKSTNINGVIFKEGNVTTTGNITASNILSSGTITMSSTTPTISSDTDLSITSTNGSVNIGGLMINNGRLTNVKSLRTTTDITIGGELSLDGEYTMEATLSINNEAITEQTLAGENGSYINGEYTNTKDGITVTVTVEDNEATITNVVISAETPDNTYIVPVSIPLLGRITSDHPIVINSTNGITIDTTTINSTGDVVSNSLSTGTINTNTITTTAPSTAINITNPDGDIIISGMAIDPNGNISNVINVTASGSISSNELTTTNLTAITGTFGDLTVSKIIVDDFTIGGVVFSESSITNVNDITCSGHITTGNLDILGTLKVDNIDVSSIGGVSFDSGVITADSLTTSGNITTDTITFMSNTGTTSLSVSELTNITKIAGITFNGTTISGLSSLTSSGTITANTLALTGSITSDVITNDNGTVTIEDITFNNGDITNVSSVTMTGDLQSANVFTGIISSVNRNLSIQIGASENVPVRAISTSNEANIQPFLTGISNAGLVLSVDGITTWSNGDLFTLTAQTNLLDNDTFEVVNNTDPIEIRRVYNTQSVFGKSYTSSDGSANNGKTFVSVNTHNKSISGTHDLIFEESITPTLTVGGIDIRDDTITASSIQTNTINIGNVQIIHTGDQSYSLTMPNSLGSDGEVLAIGSSGQLYWVVPELYSLGGVQGSIQFNNMSKFDGSPDLTWTNETGLTLSSGNKLITGQLEFSHDTVNAHITNQSGSVIIQTPNDLILKPTSGNVSIVNGIDTQVASIDQSGALVVGSSINVGPVNITDGVITGVVYTTDSSSLVSKEYVDKLALGVRWIEPVLISVNDHIDLQNPPPSINGITLSLNTKVLLLGQTDPIDNGIYFYNLNGQLSRPLSGEFASGYSASGAAINVTHIKEAHLCISATGSDTVGTHALTFIKLVSGGITTGNGLSMSGNTVFLNVNTDEFEFDDQSRLSIKKIPVNKLSADYITVSGDSGIIVSKANPKLGESFNISIDRDVIMDLSSEQTITGEKTFTNGITVNDLTVNSDLNVHSGTIIAKSFITGSVSITDTNIYGLSGLNVNGNVNVSGTTTTGTLIAGEITSTQDIVISSNTGVEIEGIAFNKNSITGVHIMELNDNISVSNIVKESGDITIMPGSGSYTVVNGVKIKENIIYDVKGIEGINNPVLFGDTTGTITFGRDASQISIRANDSIIFGTNSGTITMGDVIVSNKAYIQGNIVANSLIFTSGQTQSITKQSGVLAFTGSEITIGDISISNDEISGISELSGSKCTLSGDLTLSGQMNISGDIISSGDMNIVSTTGIVTIGQVVFNNGVIENAGDVKTNNILASDTTAPSNIFTDSAVIHIGGSDTTNINLVSSTVDITGDLTISKDTTISGDADITGDLTIAGDIAFTNGTITKVSGDLAISAPLININGVKIDQAGDLELNSMTVSGDVNVTGEVFISNTLKHETLTIGDGTINSTTTIEGTTFTTNTISTGHVQLNEIHASSGDVKILSNVTGTITIGGDVTENIYMQSDVMSLNGTINVETMDIIASNNINVNKNITVVDDIIFTGDSGNIFANNSNESDLNITSNNSVILNNVVTITSDSITSTVPMTCTTLTAGTIDTVNEISSPSGITINTPTLTFGDIVITENNNTITGVSKLSTGDITTSKLITTSIGSQQALSVVSVGDSITINESITINKHGEISGLTSLLTNSLQSSNISSPVNVYTNTTGNINFGTLADTINIGTNSTTINIGSKTNTDIVLGNDQTGAIALHANETTIMGDVTTSGNIILQGEDAVISSGGTGSISIQTGSDGTLDLNGFIFKKDATTGKTVIDYIDQDETAAVNVSLFNTTPGSVSIGGESTSEITLESTSMVDIGSDDIYLTATESINIGSTGTVNIRSGKEGIKIESSNVNIQSNVVISGDVLVTGNLTFDNGVNSNIFENFDSVHFDDGSIVNASNMIVNDTLKTNNLIVNNVSSENANVSVYSDSTLTIGGDAVVIGNTQSNVTIGSLEIQNNVIHTPERLKISANEIVLGNPDEVGSTLVVNKKVQLNGGLEKLHSLKATHMSTNYLRCDRLSISSDPTGFYDHQQTTGTFGTTTGDVNYTRMGNFVNITGVFNVTDTSSVTLILANCPVVKSPAVLRIGLFPSVKENISQLSLVDKDDGLVVRVYDSTTSTYRELTPDDYATIQEQTKFTFSGSYTTNTYTL